MNPEQRSLPLILVIDDVSPVVRLIELELSTQGFRTQSVLIGEDPVGTALRLQPSAVVLGSSLPAPPVYDVLMQLKKTLSAPVLFLHAGGNDSDAALALDMGADDALGLPFSPQDLSLRLQALLELAPPEARQLVRGPLKIDVLHRVLWNGEKKIALGTSEWTLLLALAQVEGPISASDLLASVWGEDYRNELPFLRLWIRRLRANLEDDPDHPRVIVGNEETGYILGS
ncbi:MAG: winged helix-turn-helix domain-containing protein [Dehalococcoidia bacterium]